MVRQLKIPDIMKEILKLSASLRNTSLVWEHKFTGTSGKWKLEVNGSKEYSGAIPPFTVFIYLNGFMGLIAGLGATAGFIDEAEVCEQIATEITRIHQAGTLQAGEIINSNQTGND